MTQTLAVQPQSLDYYNYFVMCNYVFNAPEPVIENSYTYEENGVLYCASATQKGVYCYSYARNCPLMYTDPSGEFVYLNLSFGWSKQGGFSISLGIGFGFKNNLSAGISVGYSFGNNSWSFNGEASYGGGYLTAGWNSTAGWNVGTGYSYGAQIGPFSVSVFSTGISYSQNGGFSANAGWVNYNQYGGFSMNAGFSVSYTATSGYSGTYDSSVAADPCGDPIPYGMQSTLEFMERNNLETNEITTLYADGSYPSFRGYRKKGDVLYNKYNERVGGVTLYRQKKYFFWGPEVINVYLMKDAFSSPEQLFLTINHEFVHVDLYYTGHYNVPQHEKTAYGWEMRQLETWGLDNTKYYKATQKIYNGYDVDPYSYFRPVIIKRPIR